MSHCDVTPKYPRLHSRYVAGEKPTPCEVGFGCPDRNLGRHWVRSRASRLRKHVVVPFPIRMGLQVRGLPRLSDHTYVDLLSGGLIYGVERFGLSLNPKDCRLLGEAPTASRRTAYVCYMLVVRSIAGLSYATDLELCHCDMY
jgi:hypothetical protein